MKLLLLALLGTPLVAAVAYSALAKDQPQADPMRPAPTQAPMSGPTWAQPTASPTGVAVVAPPAVAGPAQVVPAAPTAAPLPNPPAQPYPPSGGAGLLPPGSAPPAAPPGSAPSGVAPTDAILAAWGPPPAPDRDPRRFAEAHWQGLELIPKTPAVANAMNLPLELEGVILDDVSLPADLQGFRAGDVITRVGDVATPHLTAFVQATDRVREQPSIWLGVYRAGETLNLSLSALFGRLGTANGETPPMIPAGALSPHAYQGPCTNCHKVGTTGSLAVDQGDRTTKSAPAIRASSPPPHRDRGPCTTCHQILP